MHWSAAEIVVALIFSKKLDVRGELASSRLCRATRGLQPRQGSGEFSITCAAQKSFQYISSNGAIWWLFGVCSGFSLAFEFKWVCLLILTLSCNLFPVPWILGF